MIDLHTHTLWSDGELIPAEHIRRAVVAGYQAIAITDHADATNIEELCRESIPFAQKMNSMQKEIKVLSGIEITHVLPQEIKELTDYARGKGLDLVLVHGETIAEPVRPGTNRSAIEAKVDILAHPGLITAEEVALAAKLGVYLEITARKGHSLANGHVARLALENKAMMVLNTDSHMSDTFISGEMAEKVLLGAAIPPADMDRVFKNSRDLVARIFKK